MAIKSLEDLKRLKEDTLARRRLGGEGARARVTVAMGTCGIAAGARETMRAILDEIERGQVQDVIVTQTGCIGLCEHEPIVSVEVGDQPKVTYGKVNAERARRILLEHVVGGQAIEGWIIG